MTVRQISAHEAVVKTATVEVKTLTISGKQVTLAVFRQLLSQSIVSPEKPLLRGTPWGRVNYHPDKCAAASEHLHIVWQLGEELRRDAVYPNAIHGQRATDRHRWICLGSAATFRALDETGNGTITPTDDERSWKIEAPGGWFITRDYATRQQAEALLKLHAGEATYFDVGYRRGYYVAGGYHPTIEAARAAVLAKATECSCLGDQGGWSSADTWAEWRRHSVDMDQRVERWNAVMADLRALDQLFIAV